MPKLSLFRVGLIIAIIGVVWIGFAFSEGEKIFKVFSLNEEQRVTMNIQLQAFGIGYYKISIPEYSQNTLFVQILDPNENIITDKKIETKMSVNYFEITENGQYLLKITNISENPIKLEVELGDSNSSKMIYPGVILVAGIMLMIISGYRRLRNYSIAQPDEKIS